MVCIPQATDLWLALAKLESYKEARGVLNQALKANPTDASIYITAAKLEEAQGNLPQVKKVLSKMLKHLNLPRSTYL